jgi:hypothetical protein
MMHLVQLPVLTVFFYSLAAFRILVYRKEGARHRRHISLLAWALLVMLGGSAIEVAVNLKVVSPFDLVRAVILAVVVFAVRGNVARLIRSGEQ